MKAMNILKTVRYFLGILGAAALALACEQITDPPSRTEAPAGSGGTGRVIISASTGSAASTESAALAESAAPAESAGSPESGALPGITRTILPTQTPVFSRYRVVFSRSGYEDITLDNAQGIDGAGAGWELEAGPWTVTVSAYRALSTGGAEYEAARGGAGFTVTAGQTTPVWVSIAPVPAAEAAGKGLFTYKVTFPAGASGTLTIGSEAPVTLVSGRVVSVEIAPGYYDLSVTLSKGALSAGVWEKAHIYAGLESKAEFTFTDADFAPTVYLAGTVTLPAGVTLASGTIYIYSDADYTKKIGQAAASAAWVAGVPAANIGSTLYFLAIANGADGKTYVGEGDSGGAVGEAGKRGITAAAAARIKSLAAVKVYLANVSGGTNAGTPVSLPVELNLASDWTGLLGAIQNAGKYVALDLSVCAMSGTTFDPGTYSTGKNKIVSLILPDAATSIKSGNDNNTTFKDFTALKNVSGSGIKTVGNHAFDWSTALTTVSLPAATSIGEEAFFSCDALTTVSLPAATSIGNKAFSNCDGLTTVSLPAARSIGEEAFFACHALTTVSLPAATSIGEVAFGGCALTTVSLPAATSIGNGAFFDCKALTTVNLPAATSIGVNAFQDCEALTTVSLPAATSIGNAAFLRCDALTTVSLPAAMYIDNAAFRECPALTTVTLGSTAPTLGLNMFYGITAAKTVTVKVPTGATGYGTISATYNGSDKTVNWGNGFRGGGWNGSAIMNSSYINTNITVKIRYNIILDLNTISAYLASASGGATANDPVPLPVELNLASDWTALLGKISSAGKYVDLDLSACTMSGTTFDPGTANTGEGKIVSLILPDAATIIKAGDAPSSTFRYFSALKSVSGSGIKTVGNYAFLHCWALTTVSLPAATFIGNYAFYSCAALTTVTLPAATSIGYLAFRECAALTTVSLPAATSIDYHAFAYCDALTTVSLGSTAPTLGYDMFYDITAAKTVTVKVPSGATGYGTIPATYSGSDKTVNWGNGFRGGGWTGSAFVDSSKINTNITLKIQYQ